MHNFLNFIMEYHPVIFLFWFSVFYFFFMHYLKIIYVKFDSIDLCSYFINRSVQIKLDSLDSKVDNEFYSDQDLKIIEHRKKH